VISTVLFLIQIITINLELSKTVHDSATFLTLQLNLT